MPPLLARSLPHPGHQDKSSRSGIKSLYLRDIDLSMAKSCLHYKVKGVPEHTICGHVIALLGSTKSTFQLDSIQMTGAIINAMRNHCRVCTWGCQPPVAPQRPRNSSCATTSGSRPPTACRV